MRIEGSTIPFHLARAYGLQQPQPAAQPQAPAVLARTPAAEAVSFESRLSAAAASPARQLVAARVPGSIDFSTDKPRPSADAIPFYRAPWDKNAAAVSVQVGRGVDLQG